MCEVRRRLLEAPGVRAWLAALAELGESDPFSLDYWTAVELLSRGVDGFFLPHEIHAICDRLKRVDGMPDEWRFRVWAPHHVLEPATAQRQRGPSAVTVDLAARALIARFGCGPTPGQREPLSAQLLRLADASADADLTAECEVLSPAVLDGPEYRGGERARKARERVRRLQDWSRWGLVHPGQPWRRQVA